MEPDYAYDSHLLEEYFYVSVCYDSGLSYNKLEPLSVKRANFYTAQTISTPVFDSVFEGDVPSVLNADLQALGLGKKTPEQVCKDVQAVWDAVK